MEKHNLLSGWVGLHRWTNMGLLYDYYNENDDSSISCNVNSWYGQSFTAAASYDAVSVKLKLNSPASGIIDITLYSVDGSGLPDTSIATGTIDSSGFSAIPGAWEEITFATPYSLVSGIKYAIVVTCGTGKSTSLRRDVTSPTYSGGNVVYSTNGGVDWGNLAAQDAMFEIHGAASDPDDKTYSRTLVAMGNNQVWYGSAVATMEEVTDANGAVNTGAPLEGVTAYEKIFIANGTNLKVLDFVNTKINTTDAGATACTRGTVLTGGTSAAVMRVDYVDGVTDDAAMNAYGKRTTAATFSSGETVTGDGGQSFVLSAAETAPPHWYNWTVFGNDTTTYGTMPSSSSLVSLYRGRLVLNDDYNPHAWYMTAVGNPFKVLYDFTNDGSLSAIVHSNNKVGVIGDILTTYIAISDDLFIFGCQNSIWVLVGDPLAEGQLTQLTSDTGIWGSRSWCIDDRNNLYFLGNDGVYRCSISDGLSKPENISKLKIPTLIKDLDLDKSLHRVVLAFDPINNGVIITRTLLSDGTNTGYWLSLTTGGFFPESVPASCGIFSACFYPATDETYKKFHVGCADGYIREFDNATKNDATTASTTAIDSYVLLMQKLGIDDDSKGGLQTVTAITGGGASSGDFSDTDSIAYSLYKADDAETLIEDVIDGATAFTTGTWSGPGKQNKIRPRVGGVWGGIKLANDTASETWAINSITGNVIPKGGA